MIDDDDGGAGMSRMHLSSPDGAAHEAAPSAVVGDRLDAGVDEGGATASPPVSDLSEPVRRIVCSIPVMALVSLLGFVAMLVAFTQSTRGQLWDERARLSTGSSARAWAVIVDPLTYITLVSTGACVIVFVVIALLRRRVALAGAAVGVVTLANLTTQLFKAHWPTRPHIWSNSLPSGHTTVAMSIAVAALIVAPAGARRWLLPALGFGVTFVGAGTVVGHWHRPGDVVAAILMTTFWAALMLGCARRSQHVRGLRSRAYAMRPALGLVGSAVAGLIFIALGVRPLDHDVDAALAVLSLGTIGVVGALALAWVSTASDDAVA